MGTRMGTTTERGQSMSDAYRNACRDAEAEHGHEEGYSGHINCTYGCSDITSKYNAAKDKRKFIDELHDKMGSGECYGVELEKPKVNTNKVKTQVTRIPQKGARKWETRYVAETFDGYEIASVPAQGTAIQKARAYAEKNQTRCRVYIAKVMTQGQTKVADVSYKPSKTQKDGKYLFIYAAKD